MFQFLNGLDEEYGVHRRQLLMINSLRGVDIACSTLQQEENQTIEDLKSVKEENEGAAMISKGSDISCTVCGKTGHTKENVGLLWDFQASMGKVENSTKGR